MGTVLHFNNLSSLMSSIFQVLIITYTINFKIHIQFFLFHRRWNPQEGLYRPFGRIDSSRFWGWRWFLCLHALLGQIVRQVNSKSNQKTCWLFQWRKWFSNSSLWRITSTLLQMGSKKPLTEIMTQNLSTKRTNLWTKEKKCGNQ